MKPSAHPARLRALAGPSSRSLLLGLVLLLAAAPAAWAKITVNPRGWKFPNIITAAKEAIRVSDRTPLIPGKETVLKGYRKMDGTFFMTYEIEGRVFGVQIDTDGKPPFEESIMDTDGDGIFETKIVNGPNENDQAYVPKWVIDYYYSLHPELKNPSGKIKPPPPRLGVTAPPTPAPKPKPPAGPPPTEILQEPSP
ncbi:MAG TPA: hypothetical protein VFT43_13940 [Candidatus Polarisedimenticolia bacterium]|nr:hypothetical protein [Candidatus Polarisedimenticolia bacterium]